MRAGFAAGAAIFVSMVAIGAIRSDAFIVKYSILGLGNWALLRCADHRFLPYLESISASPRLSACSSFPIRINPFAAAVGGSSRTYHHSIIVGNLAEAAVEAVGGVLLPGGLYYLDIGKLKRPTSSPRISSRKRIPMKIAPTLSTLIITPT